ncbi:MAG: CBS domain-containing protein [Paracoccaceae bacterium]
MLVRKILADKAGTEVFSVSPDDTVNTAARILSANRIGTVVVLTEGKLNGILSERDIVRDLGKSGAACLDKKVSELMTADITTCTQADNSDAVLQLMTDGRFRHLPVLEDGALVGLISIGDVVKAQLSELAMEKDALEGMIRGH